MKQAVSISLVAAIKQSTSLVHANVCGAALRAVGCG